MKLKFKKDRFRNARGSYSRLLEIKCRKCNKLICTYQKDGPGNLRRLYLDRIFTPEELKDLQKLELSKISILVCKGCREILGTPYIYPKEKHSDCIKMQ